MGREREINLPAFFIRPPTPPPARNGRRKDSLLLGEKPPSPPQLARSDGDQRHTKKKKRNVCPSPCVCSSFSQVLSSALQLDCTVHAHELSLPPPAVAGARKM